MVIPLQVITCAAIGMYAYIYSNLNISMLNIDEKNHYIYYANNEIIHIQKIEY
jgi:hypothetical protein